MLGEGHWSRTTECRAHTHDKTPAEEAILDTGSPGPHWGQMFAPRQAAEEGMGVDGEKTAAGQDLSRDGGTGVEVQEPHLERVEKGFWAGALEGRPGGDEGTGAQGEDSSEGQEARSPAPRSWIEEVEVKQWWAPVQE